MADLVRLVPRIPPDDRGITRSPLQSPAQPEAPRRVVPSGLEDRDTVLRAGPLPLVPLDWPRPPRAWRRGLAHQGAFLFGALAWLCGVAAALGAAAWALHRIFGG